MKKYSTFFYSTYFLLHQNLASCKFFTRLSMFIFTLSFLLCRSPGTQTSDRRFDGSDSASRVEPFRVWDRFRVSFVATPCVFVQLLFISFDLILKALQLEAKCGRSCWSQHRKHSHTVTDTQNPSIFWSVHRGTTLDQPSRLLTKKLKVN